MSWWFSRDWEEYFTVVQWDQRAAGKTYLLSDPELVRPTLTRERFVADAEEMAAWVRRELGKDKIFVQGHSWGSFLGLELAKCHPKWLHAYIGVGQVTDLPESERRGWHFAMHAARLAGNSEAIDELQAIAPYAAPGATIPIKDVYTQRKWIGFFGGVMAYRQNNDSDSDLSELSPDYTDEEMRRIWEGNRFATPFLLPELLSIDVGTIRKLDIPLILLEGRHDLNVNSTVCAEWFAGVEAPKKHLVWFEHSAHMPMTEEPGKYLLSLVNYARPIAEREGDVARDRNILKTKKSKAALLTQANQSPRRA